MQLGKTERGVGVGMGVGDLWVKPGDGELGDINGNFLYIHFHVNLDLCVCTFGLGVHSDGGFAVLICDLVAMDSSEIWSEVIPLTETAKCNLSVSEVYE